MQDQPDLGLDENQEEDADAQEIQRNGTWNQQLLKAAQRGDLELVRKCLDKKANINEEDKSQKWNALIWASCKNYPEIVRLLLSRGAAQQYLQNSALESFSETNQNLQAMNLIMEEKKVKLGFINNAARQTPLQWACFKGNLLIVWLLLQSGCSWQDTDAFGNNCAHLAAAGGNLKVFQALMMYGIEVIDKNARNHEVLDLAAQANIHTLVKQHKEATKCAGTCKTVFGDMVRKHWCSTCQNIYCPGEFRIEWTWEKDSSTEMERLDGQCHKCWSTIQLHTDELVMKMSQYDHKLLTDKINEIKQHSIEIDLKTYKDALVLQEQLRTQNMISGVLDSLQHVDQYKTILQSVNQIDEMLEDAQNRGVLLDDHVVERANQERDRLVAERNLRYELDNIDSGNCNPEQVQQLKELMDVAADKNVEKSYLEQAEILRDKMARSIQTKDIYQMFVQYPPRTDWRPCVRWDHKLKKAIDPSTQQPPDLKFFLAPQKQSKKNQLPQYPDWATETAELEKQIKRIELLLKSAQELELDDQFQSGANAQIAEMKIELKYRQELDIQKKLVNDMAEAEKLQNKQK